MTERPGGVRLTASVLTHPSRAEQARELIERSHPDGRLSLVSDPDPTGPPAALRTALAAWGSIDPDSTHHLVVQDDMILSPGFFDRARRAAAVMPAAALSFFALWDSRNGGAVRLGALAGARWVAAASEYTPSAVLLLPRPVAVGFVEFALRRLDTWPDDILMRHYLRAAGVPGYVAVPNSAEHSDPPSISGNRFRGPRKSVCLPATDVGYGEDSRLTGLSVIPFCKQGRAQCSVRMPGSNRWHDIPTERYLAGLGFSVDRLRRAFATEAHGVPAGWTAWLTAFAMAVVRRVDGGALVSGTDQALPDRVVVAEAIRTIGAGALCHDTPLDAIDRLHGGPLAEIAERGLRAGNEHPTPDRDGSADSRILRVGVRGDQIALRDFLIRGLRDHGWNAGPDEEAVQSDVVVNLDGVPTAPTDTPVVSSRPTPVRLIWNRGGRRHRRLLRFGDLYGPGCSPHSRIGLLVAAAVLGRPIRVEESPAASVHPLHVEDFVTAIHEALLTGPADDGVEPAHSRPYSMRELAECVRASIRPVPIEFTAGSETEPAASAPTTSSGFVELGFGLHTFAQWLAYESGPGPEDSADPFAISG